MLGLADFLKAVRGSAGIALRRAHPLAGPALLVALWVVSLGTFFWLSSDDSDSVDDASPRSVREQTGGATEDDGDGAQEAGDRSVPGAAEAEPDGVLDEPVATTLAPSPEPDRTVDGSASTPAPTSPPPPLRPSVNSSTPTRPTTTTTTAPSPTSPPTTAPPPENNGGLVGGLLDLLGLGG